jgi:hypothetical protein
MTQEQHDLIRAIWARVRCRQDCRKGTTLTLSRDECNELESVLAAEMEWNGVEEDQ